MNDPLKDNRIFPEEMHEKIEVEEKKPMNLSWLWTLLVILGVAALIWFGYRYYQKNLKPEPTQIKETVLPSAQGQQDAFDSLESASPELQRVERQQKINTLFGN